MPATKRLSYDMERETCSNHTKDNEYRNVSGKTWPEKDHLRNLNTDVKKIVKWTSNKDGARVWTGESYEDCKVTLSSTEGGELLSDFQFLKDSVPHS
jgi:hypothetical protein